MTQKEVEITPSRITVLDAGELDSEIYNILSSQLNIIITNLPIEVSYFEPELQTLLKTSLWMLSVQRTSATFGQQLLRIRYSKLSPKRSLCILGLVQIGTSYLKQRLPNFLCLFHRSSTFDLGFKIVEWSGLLASIVQIIYFVKFLRQGGASTFLEFILSLKPISIVSQSSRNIGYSFMTRELLWHGLIELLVLVIPMINYHALKRKFRNYITVSTLESKDSVQDLSKNNLKCAVCKEFPILPHHMGCSHLFCYYCLLSHRLADKKFECPVCGYSNPDASVIPLSLKW